MGRLDANSGPSERSGQHHQQPREYHFQPTAQSPETIDDATPPPFEASNDESQQENFEENDPPKKVENAHQNRQAQSRPTPSRGPMAFPPQNTQLRSPPPSGHQLQAFPPASQDRPQAFPTSQDEQQAFPPPHQPNGKECLQYIPMGMACPSVQAAMARFSPQGMASPSVQAAMACPVVQAGSTPIDFLPTEAWKTGLFECMDDPTNALITVCFPCVTFGQIAEIADSGQNSCGTRGMLYGLISLIGMPCLLSCTYRTKIRGRYGIMESPAPDWIIHCCCECCALCQEYRELQRRGIDPSIGWLGNVAKIQQMVQLGAMTRPMRQTMMG